MVEVERETNSVDQNGSDRLAKHLYRFFPSVSEALSAIDKFVIDHPDAESAEIFNELAHGKGAGKSHASAHPDTGEFREGVVTVSKRRRKRR